jgi:hypothetical protein
MDKKGKVNNNNNKKQQQQNQKTNKQTKQKNKEVSFITCESSAPFLQFTQPGANPRRIGERLV